jgi:hypothetical protein
MYDNNINGLVGTVELDWLYNKAKEMQTILEVGAWRGRVTAALCEACPGIVTSVDHFLGSVGDGLVPDEKEKQEDQVYKDFLENTKQFKNLIVNRNDSIVAAFQYPDLSFDMVWLDAQHTYESTIADIRAWLPKAKNLICGHDYSEVWPGTIKAVDEMFSNIELFNTIWIKRL